MSLSRAVAMIDQGLFKDRVEHYPQAVHSVIPVHFVEIEKGHSLYAVDLGPPPGVGLHLVGLLHVDRQQVVQRVGVVAEAWAGRPEFVVWVGGAEDVDDLVALGLAAKAHYANGGKPLVGGPAVDFNQQRIDPAWLEEQGVA